MNQLHETYLNLVTNEGNTNIILMGDSAGGNLSLGYLQFLKKSTLREYSLPIEISYDKSMGQTKADTRYNGSW